MNRKRFHLIFLRSMFKRIEHSLTPPHNNSGEEEKAPAGVNCGARKREVRRVLNETTIFESLGGLVVVTQLEHIRDDGSVGLVRYSVRYKDTHLPLQETKSNALLLCSLLLGGEIQEEKSKAPA